MAFVESFKIMHFYGWDHLCFGYVNDTPLFRNYLEQFFWDCTFLYMSGDILMISSKKNNPPSNERIFFWKCLKSPGKDNNQPPVTCKCEGAPDFLHHTINLRLHPHQFAPLHSSEPRAIKLVSLATHCTCQLCCLGCLLITCIRWKFTE